MNSLLKRQIRKFLPPDLAERDDLEAFFAAVSKSYDNFDEQSVMIQRAMQLSSEELFEANNKLRKETEAQKKVITQLKQVIDTLKIHELPQNNITNKLEVDGGKLIDYINKQASDIVNANRQREELLKNLEFQNEELSNYAHMVSHDLKSPLRSIDALAMWVHEDFVELLSEDGQANLKLIRTNVQKMEDLINGILEYSTIDKAETEVYDVDINFLVPDLIKSMYVPEHIQINIKDRLPVLKGDKLRFTQLFQNLIGNAIKYNDKQRGIINVGCTAKGKKWEFYVEDNGKGIPEQYFE